MFDGGPLPHEPIEPWRSFKQENDRRALLHDRLKALGAFSAIAIGAVAGFEMVIGGGFDFITPAPEVREVAPSRYVTVHQVPWSSQLQVIPLSSTEPLFAGEVAVETASDSLAGGYDDPSAPDMAFPEIDEDELYRQIAALYANDAGPDYDDAPITYEDAPAIDEPQRPATAAPDELTRAEETMADVLAGAEFAGLDPKPS
jgi:hypothetical protein